MLGLRFEHLPICLDEYHVNFITAACSTFNRHTFERLLERNRRCARTAHTKTRQIAIQICEYRHFHIMES